LGLFLCSAILGHRQVVGHCDLLFVHLYSFYKRAQESLSLGEISLFKQVTQVVSIGFHHSCVHLLGTPGYHLGFYQDPGLCKFVMALDSGCLNHS